MPDRAETFAQLIAAIKDAYGIASDSELARRVGVSPATAHTWSHGKRGTGYGPKPESIRALAKAFPKFSEARIEAAAGRKVPGPLSPDKEQRLLDYYRELTEEQQRMKLVEMQALAEHNRTPGS